MPDDARADRSGAREASAREIIRLWPGGAPRGFQEVGPETAYGGPAGVAVGTTTLCDISDPTLTVYSPAPGAANGIGMIGFSDGAFLAADIAMNPGGPPLAFVAPIYGGETSGHGFGMVRQGLPVDRWIDLLADWLADQEFV